MKNTKDSIDSLDGQLMVMAAHRYCLGRQSYIVGSCIDWIKTNWDKFEANTKNVLMRDTAEALMNDLAGADCITRGWRNLLAWMEKQHPEGSDWAKRATAHKQQPWPTSEEEQE